MVSNSQRRPSLDRLVFTSGLIYKYTRIESQYTVVRRHISSLGMYQKVLRVMMHRLQKRTSQMDEN